MSGMDRDIEALIMEMGRTATLQIVKNDSSALSMEELRTIGTYRDITILHNRRTDEYVLQTESEQYSVLWPNKSSQ